MRSFTDKEVIDRVASVARGFNGWRDGIYDVWVRSRADAYDRFDDKVFTYKVTDGVPNFVMACTGTTNAGSFGLLHFRTYNPEGCAVLDGDTIVYGSHRYGLHKGKKPAYVQCRPFPYHRDNDRDHLAEDTIGPEHNDIIGANCHRAGVFSSVIGNWSVACLVRNQLTQFLAWLAYMKSQKYPQLNVCILREW